MLIAIRMISEVNAKTKDKAGTPMFCILPSNQNFSLEREFQHVSWLSKLGLGFGKARKEIEEETDLLIFC